MVRHRTLALVAIAYFLVVPGISVRAGQLPDIRGLSFVDPFQGVTFFAGDVAGFGSLTYPLTDPTAPTAFNPTIPSTFDVTADPAAPNDPSHIQIDTRLTTDIGDGPVVYVPLTLTGTYDQTTGALSASGGATGTFLDKLGTDFSGLFPGTFVYFQVTNPRESLHGLVSVSGNAITITGTDPVVTPGDPGNISFASGNLLWIPVGSTDPNDAVFSAAVHNPTGAIYNWSATSVPEPGSMVLMLSGLAASSVGWKLRRGRSA
jgi:PEP-CTERM motif